MVDLAVVKPSVVVDVHLRSAHHVRDDGRVVVVREKLQVVVHLVLADQVGSEPAERVVVEGVEPVELHAVGLLQLVGVELLKLALVGREERAVDVVHQVKLQLGVDSIPTRVQVAYLVDDRLEHPSSALKVAVLLVVVGKRRDYLHLVAGVHVLEMCILGELQYGEVASDYHLVGNLGRLVDEPFQVGVHLGGPSGDVERPVPARIEGRKARLHGVAAHDLLRLGRAFQEAVRALQVAGVPDVDLHGAKRGAGKQVGVVDAVGEGPDSQRLAAFVEHREVGHLPLPCKIQAQLRPFGVVEANVLAPGGDLEVGCIAAGSEHLGHVPADRDRPVLDQAHLVGQVEVARILGDGAEVRGRLPVVLLAVLEVCGLDRPYGVAVEGGEPQLRGRSGSRPRAALRRRRRRRPAPRTTSACA